MFFYVLKEYDPPEGGKSNDGDLTPDYENLENWPVNAPLVDDSSGVRPIPPFQDDDPNPN